MFGMREASCISEAKGDLASESERERESGSGSGSGSESESGSGSGSGSESESERESHPEMCPPSRMIHTAYVCTSRAMYMTE